MMETPTPGNVAEAPTPSKPSDLIFSEVTQRFEPDGAFRGQTRSTFKNSFVCSNPPTYTYYLYNRVYGHKNGTATISQSSQTYDDCLPLHVFILTGYN